MFTHAVLFEINKDQVRLYKKDNLMWARYARRAKGFVSYHTVKRIDHKNQFASVYVWKNKRSHDSFMRRYHDWLVGKSSAKVNVLGYFNLEQIQITVKKASNHCHCDDARVACGE